MERESSAYGDSDGAALSAAIRMIMKRLLFYALAINEAGDTFFRPTRTMRGARGLVGYWRPVLAGAAGRIPGLSTI